MDFVIVEKGQVTCFPPVSSLCANLSYLAAGGSFLFDRHESGFKSLHQTLVKLFL